MAYARWGKDSDVYVYMSVLGHLECCGCWFGGVRRFMSTQAMVDHLATHRAAGHTVPDDLEADLWEDDTENWTED